MTVAIVGASMLAPAHPTALPGGSSHLSPRPPAA